MDDLMFAIGMTCMAFAVVSAFIAMMLTFEAHNQQYLVRKLMYKRYAARWVMITLGFTVPGLIFSIVGV